MSRATSDDQLKFLLSCVRHSNNGKIDFIEVAKECGVVSKGAAAKRYERLLKANGIHPSGGPAEKPSSSAPKQKTKADIIKSAAAKRRKIEDDPMHWQVDDEDDFKPHFKHEPMEVPRVKPEPGTGLLPYFAQHHNAPAQPSFLPRPFVPPIPMHLPYAVPLPQLHQYPHPQRLHAVPQQMHPTIPRPLPNAQASVSLSSQQQPLPVTQHSQPVKEEQIDSMFVEFCAQDMFKSPNFDAPPPTRSKDVALCSVATVLEHPAAESQVSPKTTGCAIVEPLGADPVPKVAKEEQAVQAVATIAAEQPSGADVENSILIMD